MELQKMIDEYMNYSFEDIINIRDRNSCRMYNTSESTLNLYTSQITESYLKKTN